MNKKIKRMMFWIAMLSVFQIMLVEPLFPVFADEPSDTEIGVNAETEAEVNAETEAEVGAETEAEAGAGEAMPLQLEGISGKGLRGASPTPEHCFMTWNVNDGEIAIGGYKSHEDDCGLDVNIPNSIDGRSVTTIAMMAFAYRGLTSVVIPEGVVTIEDRAFADNQLTSIAIPNSVTTIGREAFANNQLPDEQAFIYGRKPEGGEDKAVIIGYAGTSMDIVIPDGVQMIKDYVFAHNQLTSVTIPNSVTSIGDRAFSMNQLTSVTIPNSVTSIGNHAFAYNQLTSVSIPNSLTTIESQAFANNQLTSVVIPNSVTTIGDAAFAGNQLTSVIIPDSVTTIESQAFARNQLTSVTIPSSVTSIWRDAFAYNQLPDEQAFIYGRKTEGGEDKAVIIGYGGASKNIVIPDGVQMIKDQAFVNNQLTSVVISNSVTTIEHQAFARNQLTSVTIPDSVTSIEGGAFSANPGMPEYGGKVEGLVTKDPSTISLNNYADLHLVRAYKLKFDTDGGSAMEPLVFKTGALVALPAEVPTKTGYIFSGRNTPFPFEMPEADVEIKALWNPEVYTLTFNLDGGVGNMLPITGTYDMDMPVVAQPTKTGYSFAGWNPELPNKISRDQTFTALWNVIAVPSESGTSSGGGGYSGRGSSSSHRGGSSTSVSNSASSSLDVLSSIMSEEMHGAPSAQPERSTTFEGLIKDFVQEHQTHPAAIEALSTSIASLKRTSVSQELKDAYLYAYVKGIITQDTVEKARLDKGLTRAEMAKMMSVYATAVLGKKPVKSDTVQYADVGKMDGDLPEYIQLAYQLQIMGIYADGKALESFNPKAEVTRAEFATVLSRVLYGDKYNQDGKDFAAKHLAALKDANILKDTSPVIKEMRGWVMLMLQRAEGVK